MTFKQQLENINACKEAREWLQDKTLQEAFTTCERADWMLWAYARLYPDNLRELTLAKGHCVNTVRHLMKDDRSIAAIDAAINYGNGIITLDELNAAATSAYATNAATYAATADYAAAAATAAATDYAAAATAAATDYAAAAATAATAAAARKQSLKEQADICRKYLTL
jgi:hypothetical protein